MADGDGRAALTLAEEVWRAARPGEVFDAEGHPARRAAPRAGLRQGTGRALQSDLRAAQVGARLRSGRGALLSRARMFDAGEDPLYLGRRLVRMAVEDIGLADPQALVIAMPPRTPTIISVRPRGNAPSRRPASTSPPPPSRTRSTPLQGGDAFGQGERLAAAAPSTSSTRH